MYDYNLTAQEISDYNADMLELAGTEYQPTDEEMEEMFADATNRKITKEITIMTTTYTIYFGGKPLVCTNKTEEAYACYEAVKTLAEFSGKTASIVTYYNPSEEN